MGSGNNNRKGNDSPFIRRPVKKIGLGIGIPDRGTMAPEVCVPSFDKRVVKSNLTQPGVKVRLQKKDAVYDICIGNNVVGSLNEKFSKMVANCSKMGVGYNGEILVKNGEVYARFNRVSK